MRLKMRLQPTPKTRERRALRIIALSAGLSIVVFSVFFIYLNMDGRKNAQAETDSPVSSVIDNILNFTGTAVPEGVKLNWHTSSEVNNDYFTIEHSADGLNFEALDNVDGSGNSDRTIQYNYTDESPAEGINYYRLCQTTIDGNQKTYNPIISVKLGDNPPSLSVVNVYPNPFNGDFLLTYRSDEKANTTMQILNAGGKSVYSETLKSDSGVNVYDFSNKIKLDKGIFFVSLSQGKTKTEAIRIVKK
jgi:hypothetical protein